MDEAPDNYDAMLPLLLAIRALCGKSQDVHTPLVIASDF